HLLRRLTHSDRIAKSATIQIPASNRCTFRDSITDGELQGYCQIPDGAILNIIEAVGAETQNITVKINEGHISLRDANIGLPNISLHLFTEFPRETAREIGGGMMLSTQDCSFE
ncbi:MAG: hypothetical protein NTV34_08140, partial [Proteobacteria bacterium]|nr:hypothetical protein [Pseudomonadota bacterium]